MHLKFVLTSKMLQQLAKNYLITYNFQPIRQIFELPSYRHGLPASRVQGCILLLEFSPLSLHPVQPGPRHKSAGQPICIDPKDNVQGCSL